MYFEKNIEYNIIAYIKISSYFVVKFQVANFLQNTLYTFSITWIKQYWTKH